MEEQKPIWRAALHYLSAAVILAVYGVQVCPFLETLSVTQLVLPILLTLSVQFALRSPMRSRFVSGAPYHKQTFSIFKIEYGLFLGAGVFLMVFNTVMYSFPLTSGLKIIVGLATLGFFAAIDLSLEWQRKLVDHFRATGHHMQIDENYFPLTGKLGLFTSISVVFIMGVIVLVINKDLIWLRDVGRSMSYETAQMLILVEVAFVIGVILAHVLNVIYAYVRNLRGFLDSENGILKKATRGDLEGFVPVGTNDEFGVMALHTNAMIKGLRDSNEEIRRTRDVSILTLASLAETRDNETGAHILRTQRYILVLAEHLRDHPRFKDVLSAENIELLYKSAPLHDIGKVGIPDNILLKPGKLTPEEFEIMKTHAKLGAEALRVSEKELGSNSFLHFAREISLSHHEKWDGSGYPYALKGDAIPVSGRLMALADVYDALISKRVYKKAFSHAEARDLLLEGRSSHFDPDVLDAFLACEQRFISIAEEFSDHSYAERTAADPEDELAIA